MRKRKPSNNQQSETPNEINRAQTSSLSVENYRFSVLVASIVLLLAVYIMYFTNTSSTPREKGEEIETNNSVVNFSHFKILEEKIGTLICQY